MPAENVTITAQWTPINYTVTFNGNGGIPSKESMVIAYDSTYGELPTVNRIGHTFTGWFTGDNEEITSETTYGITENQTLYAHWVINNYTITFDFANGTMERLILPFNSTITYPGNMTIDGFTFNGWSPKPERMPAENITIKAQWDIITAKSSESEKKSESEMSSGLEKPSRFVEITFSTKELSREEAEKIIEKYTNGAEFVIEEFGSNGSGDVKMIIKFIDKKEATSFVEKVSASSDTGKGIIKVVGFIESVTSFSSVLSSSLLIYFIL